MPKVRAVERAVSILRAFDPKTPKLTLGEIARRTGLDKATVNRLLGTLIGCNMVVQDPISREYWLGLDVLSLGASVPGQHDLQQITDPVLRDISVKTGCLAFLATFSSTGAQCLARSVINPPVQVQLWNVGETRPYNQGAGPKLLFAHLPHDRQAAYLTQELPAATSQTITDKEVLMRTVAELRGRDAAFSRDDIIEGLSALAHAVRSPQDEVIAVISIVGLTPLFSEAGRKEMGTILAQGASELSRHLATTGLITLGAEAIDTR